jgi:hypothetical protein
MNISIDYKTLIGLTSLAKKPVLTLVLVMMLGGLSWAESSDASSSEAPKAEPAANDAKTPTPGAETSPDLEQDLETSEPPMISNPMKMRFRISKLDRGISSESRVFVAPRVITLTSIGPVAHLAESTWRGKRLAVFHKSPVYSKSGSLLGMSEEKVGEIKIQSVYQSTLQALVVLDDVTRGLQSRKGEARVVMLGDIARLERPIKAPPKPKVKRYVKPKKRSPYEREDMRWRL